MILHHSKY